MRTIFLTIAASIAGIVLSGNIYAASSYTLADVASHNTPEDCWMVIGQQVYNLTEYLSAHDKELDIRSWCGTDATQAYATKNGMDRDHSDRADSLLEQYVIGIYQPVAESTSVPVPLVKQEKSTGGGSRYNLWIPLIATIVLYLISLKLFSRRLHTFIWNTVMLVGLIPSFFFGIGMILAKQVSWLSMFSASNILYSHVELSIVFGVSCLLHFITRFAIYKAQGKTNTPISSE